MAPRRCRSSWLASRWATTLVRTLPLPERDVWHAQAFGKRAGGADPSRLATIGPGRRRRQDAWRRPCPRTTRSHGFLAAAVRCPSLAAERRRAVLARRVGQAFRFGFRHYYSTDPSGPRLGDQASVSPATARAIGGPKGASSCRPDRSMAWGDGSRLDDGYFARSTGSTFWLCSDPSGSLRGAERAGFRWNPPFIPLVRSRDLTRETGKGTAHGVALPSRENGRKKFPSGASFGSCLGFAVPSMRAGAKLDLAPFVRLALVVIVGRCGRRHRTTDIWYQSVLSWWALDNSS